MRMQGILCGIILVPKICLKYHENVYKDNISQIDSRKFKGLVLKAKKILADKHLAVKEQGSLKCFLWTRHLCCRYFQYACNFKCGYCIFSVDKQRDIFISDKIIMDFGLYQNAWTMLPCSQTR